MWFDRAVEPFAVLLLTADDPALQRCAPHDLQVSPISHLYLAHISPTRCAPHDLQVASHEDDAALDHFLQVLEGLHPPSPHPP